jgi:alcohol dehydrogenase (quinone), cytochrome c subunit
MPRQLPQGKAGALSLRAVTASALFAFGLPGLVACRGEGASAPSANAAPPAPDAIARGRYVAAAANCVSCHTRPGGAPFAGGLPFPTPLGTIHSTNITPDLRTGIGSWTAADLRRALQLGRSRAGAHLFPVFPYPAFTRISDADVDALYAYLRSVPGVSYEPPRNGLMFTMRWPMVLWNALFFRPGRHVADPARPAEWNRGAYLVEGPGHCGACHTPRNLLLAERADRALQGGMLRVDAGNGRARSWSAVDLTPSTRGLGPWSVAELAQYFKSGVSARAGSFGPMNEVILNSLAALTPEDLRAMAVYLKSLPPRRYADAQVTPQQASAGAPIYKARCEKCHGRSGRGGMFSGPPLAGSAVVQSEDPASLINIVLSGSDAPEAISSQSWDTMPSYRGVLDDAQVAAVSNFLRASWGNRGGVIKAAAVRSQR